MKMKTLTTTMEPHNKMQVGSVTMEAQ